MFESNRREFIRALVGGAAGLTVNATVFGQAGPAPTPVTATKLTDRLVVMAGAGGNVALVVGADGLLMVWLRSALRSPYVVYGMWQL